MQCTSHTATSIIAGFCGSLRLARPWKLNSCQGTLQASLTWGVAACCHLWRFTLWPRCDGWLPLEIPVQPGLHLALVILSCRSSCLDLDPLNKPVLKRFSYIFNQFQNLQESTNHSSLPLSSPTLRVTLHGSPGLNWAWEEKTNKPGFLSDGKKKWQKCHLGAVSKKAPQSVSVNFPRLSSVAIAISQFSSAADLSFAVCDRRKDISFLFFSTSLSASLNGYFPDINWER